MSGLTERLEAVVNRELRKRGGEVASVGIGAALVAGLEVLAEEFGPRPEDAADGPEGDGARALALLESLGIPPDARIVTHTEWDPLPGERAAQVYTAKARPRGCFFLAYPEDAAPPVRELPTEPGAVILATEVRGVGTLSPPHMLVLHPPGQHKLTGAPWSCVTEDIGGYWWLHAADIVAWVETTVVPTAALDQVRAELAAIADASRFDPLEPPENVLADLRERAAEAVNVLDGEVGK